MRVFASLVLAGACAITSGCAYTPDSFGITFVNDTGQNAVVNLCDDDACHTYDYSDKLRPGGAVPGSISPDVFTRWAVTDSSGRRLGCLPINFTGAGGFNDAVARLSQMVPAPVRHHCPSPGDTERHPTTKREHRGRPVPNRLTERGWPPRQIPPIGRAAVCSSAAGLQEAARRLAIVSLAGMPPRHTDQSLPLLNEAELMLDENPNCARTYASFRLTGDALDPEVVTTTLGIKPIRALAKNQAIPTIRRGNGTRRQRTGVWALTSQGIMSSTSLERHLIYLLDAIEPAATPLDTLRVEHNLQADFFCYWLSATGHGGPELSPRTLDRIAALDARLGIDFYGPFDPN